MPKLAQQVDKCTLIRSMSYTPKGLFNHTAAIYQMLTGYPPDSVTIRSIRAPFYRVDRSREEMPLAEIDNMFIRGFGTWSGTGIFSKVGAMPSGSICRAERANHRGQRCQP